MEGVTAPGGKLMAGSRKKVNIQYRKLEDVTNGFAGVTLQAALAKALEFQTSSGLLEDNAAARLFDKDKGYGTIVLNYVDSPKQFFFGEIVRFEPGADLPLLELGTSVKAYNLTQAKAPQGHEPIRGVLYFMAVGNHVMVLENDVSTGRAETYFSWLLGDLTKTIADGTHVILVAELSAQSGAAQLAEVQEVIFRPRAASGATAPVSQDLIPTTVGSTTRGVEETNTWDVLKAAGMDEADIQKLVNDETSIEIVLQIKFKGQRRRRLVGIEDANRLLRNVPEDQITLFGPGGRQKEGRIVKLAYPANVEQIGSLLRTDDVARALFEGYKYFVANGYIGE